MKVLFWTGLFPPYIGGLETFSLELLHELQRRGHEAQVISIQAKAELPEFSVYQGIPVHRFDFSRTLASQNFARINAMLKRVCDLKTSFAPDVIHMNDHGVGNFFQLRTAHSYPCPTVMTMHTPLPAESVRTSLAGRMMLSATWVVAISQAVYAKVMNAAPEIAPHTSVLLNGLSMPPVDPTPLPYDPPHFLMIGRMVPDKGFDLALEAFAALLPHFPNIRLTLAGDGMVRGDLEAQARHLEVEHATHFRGWVAPDDIPALINTTTAVVMPSRWDEPFGLVALEGAQMARPVIVTRVGGLPEIVLDGETGLVVEPENSVALAAAMRFVLESPGEAARMGRAARQRAERHFSMGHMVDAYERLFLKLAGEAKT